MSHQSLLNLHFPALLGVTGDDLQKQRAEIAFCKTFVRWHWSRCINYCKHCIIFHLDMKICCMWVNWSWFEYMSTPTWFMCWLFCHFIDLLRVHSFGEFFLCYPHVVTPALEIHLFELLEIHIYISNSKYSMFLGICIIIQMHMIFSCCLIFTEYKWIQHILSHVYYIIIIYIYIIMYNATVIHYLCITRNFKLLILCSRSDQVVV